MAEYGKAWYGEQLEVLADSENVRRAEEQKLRDISEKIPAMTSSDPSLLDTATAAFSLYNPITSYIVNEPLPDVPYIEGYNPVDDIEGYERYWQSFVDSNNPETTEVIKGRIDNQMRNREVLGSSGAVASTLTTVAAGLADPFNLALMMVPGAYFVRSGQIVQSAARSAAIGSVATIGSEATLYNTQETRGIDESIVNLVATASIDAILGAGTAKLMAPAERAVLQKSVTDHLSGNTVPQSQSIGAAAVSGKATGSELKRATAFFKYTGLEYLGRQALKINPLGRLATSQDKEVRGLVQDMAEFTLSLEQEGGPAAVETLIKTDLRRTDKDIFVGRALQKESGMSPQDFSVAVTEAQRRGDTSSNPQVQKLAEYLRPKMDEMWQRAADAKIPGAFREMAEYTDDSGALVRIPVDELTTPAGKKILEKSTIVTDTVESNTAESFLRRVYDVQSIRKDPTGYRQAWKAGLNDLMARERVAAQEALDDYILTAGKDAKKSRVNELQKAIKEPISDEAMEEMLVDIYEKTANLKPGDIHAQAVTPTGGSGMFKGRVQIADEFVEDFLVKDWERLYEGYTKTLSSRIRMAERFGDGDGDFMMNGTFARLEERYAAQRTQLEEAGDLEAAQKLTRKKDKDIRDLKHTRDSLLGLLHTSSYGDPRNQLLTSVLRGARSWNVATKLNSVLTASIPDVARIVTYNGGKDFAPSLRHSLKSLKLSSMPTNDAAALASATERVSAYRLQQFTDVDDALPLTKAEEFAKYVSDKAMTVSGIKHWNSINKAIVGSMANNRLVKAVKDGVDDSWLKSIGIDDDLIDVVRREINKNASFEDKLWNMNLDKWDSVAAIDAVEAGIIKEADRVVLTPGVGDKPIFMSTEAGATIFQFKSFIAASMNRLVFPLMQEQGARKWAEINTLIAMGAFTYYLRETLAGREPSDDPAVILREGIDRSGLSGYILELYNMTNKMAGNPFGDTPARYRSRDLMGAMLGPSVGTMSEVGKSLNVNSTADSRVHAMRKLMPLQNHFLLAYPITKAEGEIAKALGGTGRFAEKKNIGTAVQSAQTAPEF